MKQIYIVIATRGVGGAEKRFVAIWHNLVLQGFNIHLIIDQVTYQELLKQTENRELSNHTNIHVLNLGGSFWHYCYTILKYFASQPRNSIVHFPMGWCPGLRLLYGHRIIVSWVGARKPIINRTYWKLNLVTWSGFFLADHIDILNPNNYHKFIKNSILKQKLTLTSGGTFIDSKIYKPGIKSLKFVFLGRNEPEKQGLRFIQILPDVDYILKNTGLTGYQFIIYGSGSESDSIRNICESDSYKNIPLYFKGYTPNPELVLGEAAMFFSLQRISNYPSKALAEAMACGSFPVLTDVGESRLMIDGCPYFHFVPRDFTAGEIADSIKAYLSITGSPEKRKNIANQISKYAIERFKVENQCIYFSNIYKNLINK